MAVAVLPSASALAADLDALGGVNPEKPGVPIQIGFRLQDTERQARDSRPEGGP